MATNVILHEEQLARSSLGHQIGDHYKIHAHTLEVLNSINKRLNEDDKILRPYRRALTFSRIIQKDLVPILVNSQVHSDIFDAVVRLLVNITLPVECLFPAEVMANSEVGKQTVYELNYSLKKTKELYRDSRTTRPVMERLCAIFAKDADISSGEVTMVNNCLLLLRNILHIPDVSNQGRNARSVKCSNQNQIMWNLFSQNLDNVLIDLICHSLSGYWSATIVQLIALVYKDQHVVTLQQLLQNFLESTMSESSEDNESNTSPPDRSGSCSSDLLSMDDRSDGNSGSGSGSRNSPNIQETRSSPPIQKARNPDSYHSSNRMLSKKTTFAESKDMAYISQESGIESSVIEADFRKPPSNKRANAVTVFEQQCALEEQSEEPPQKKRITEVDGNPSAKSILNGQSSPKREVTHKRKVAIAAVDEPISLSYDKTTNIHDSDSSEITGVPKRSKVQGSSGDISDYGYVSQQTIESENQEYLSTSSNEEEQNNSGKKNPPHTNLAKPRNKKVSLTLEEKKEKRRLTLLKRSKANRLKVKAMVNHIPTDEDISELLKEFTVDFLLKGYSDLVNDILQQLMNDDGLLMDKSHFLWLITYFLKFTGQLELDLAQMNSVLSFKMLSYLTFVGVEQLEMLELAHRKRRRDLTPHLRRMHLVVTALREFIQTLDLYESVSSITKADKKKIRLLHLQACYTREIRQLILLLLRRYKPVIQPLQYLSDLVVSNHMLLVKTEEAKDCPDYIGPPFDMTEHVRQFANAELMRQYGRLLEDFSNNSQHVNDCIFTIMHHIAGDLNSPETLCMPSILKSFSKIWEQGKEVCDEWTDLIEYVIQKFIQTMGSMPHSCATNMVESLDDAATVDDYGFTPVQASTLLRHYTQVENTKDPVGAIIEIYRQMDNKTLPRVAIIQELISQNIITHAQYMNLMYMKSMMLPYQPVADGSIIAEIGSGRCDSVKDEMDERILTDKNTDNKDLEIHLLTDCLLKQGRGLLITWLQESLLDACRVKMYPTDIIPEGSPISHEPIPFYYNLTKQSIPLVPWSRAQDQGLQTEAFILLLHKLGFLLPADVGKIFPRIPHFWSADHMYGLASKLGPIQNDQLRFSIDELEAAHCQDTKLVATPNIKPESSPEYEEMSMDMDKYPDILMDDMDSADDIEQLDLMPTHDTSAVWQQLALTSKQLSTKASPSESSPDFKFMDDLQHLSLKINGFDK